MTFTYRDGLDGAEKMVTSKLRYEQGLQLLLEVS